MLSPIGQTNDQQEVHWEAAANLQLYYLNLALYTTYGRLQNQKQNHFPTFLIENKTHLLSCLWKIRLPVY